MNIWAITEKCPEGKQWNCDKVSQLTNAARISACIYQATVWCPHLPLPHAYYRSPVQTSLFHVLTSSAAKKTGGKVFVSGSFILFNSNSVARPQKPLSRSNTCTWGYHGNSSLKNRPTGMKATAGICLLDVEDIWCRVYLKTGEHLTLFYSIPL